jgi:hypothetical protein
VGQLHLGERFEYDPPEFIVIHVKGNEENIFDRVDYQLSKADSMQLNLGFTRSWFQNPNSFDNVLHTGQTDPAGNPLSLFCCEGRLWFVFACSEVLTRA